MTLVGLLLPTVVTWVYFDLLSTWAAAVQQVAYAVGKAVQFALPLLGWKFRQARVAKAESSTSEVKPEYARSMLWGLVTGVAIAAFALAMYHWVLEPSGWMDAAKAQAQGKLKDMGLNSLAVFMAVALFYSLCHSGLEEYYWRWFVFRHLTQRWSVTTATVVSSLGFMAHHVLVLARYFGWSSPLTYGLAFSVAIGGVIWAVMYRRYGTLVGPWLSHACVDAAIFAIAYQMVDWSNAT